MTALKKREVILQIRDIEESNCVGCEKVKKWKKDLGNYQGSVKCMTDCAIGKQLQRLGDVLTYGRPTKAARELTDDKYLEHRDDQGMTDVEICKMYEIGSKTLKDRKRHWGLTKDQEKWTKLPVADYMQMREDGLSDELICMRLSWDRKTMDKFKKRHDIKLKPLHHVTHTEDGHEITPELYHKDIQIHQTDRALAEAWGVNISTFERIKRKWREGGLL